MDRFRGNLLLAFGIYCFLSTLFSPLLSSSFATPRLSHRLQTTQPTPSAQPAQPRLIVLLVIDQFPGSYLRRFLPFFSSGLKKLISEGVVFENGFHDHGITETCPGHASISTGRFPSVHGVVSNHWYERESKQYRYCAHDEEKRVGPYALSTSTFADHIREFYPKAKIAAVSGKDRAAVMLGGKHPDIAAWFSADTLSFETSKYYQRSRGKASPLLTNFSPEMFVHRYRDAQWHSSDLSEEELIRADIHPLDERPSLLNKALLPRDGEATSTERIGRDFVLTPFLDEYTAEVARAAAQSLRMGATEGQTDLLAVSFSAIDYIGHRYGPHSREMLEALIVLDRTIGALLKALDTIAGRGNYVVALTSDHGVQPLPEVETNRGKRGRRITPEEVACVARATQAFPFLKKGRWFSPVSFWLPEHLRGIGEKWASFVNPLERAIMSCGWVAQVVYLSGSPRKNDEDHRHHPQDNVNYNSVYAGRSPDIHLVPREGVTPELGRDAVHGSPYWYDTNVPILFWREGNTAQRLSDHVPTVAVTPVLAAVAKIPPPRSDAEPSIIEFVTARLLGDDTR